MNLRDLKYLVAVAELNNFSLAAERCFVSQPTLSAQIKKLENELDVVIFERNNRFVRLTDAGERIVAASRRILMEVESIQEIAASAHDPFAGMFRLGAIPTVASYVFPSIVASIIQALPELKLLLVEEKTDHLVEQLLAGRCDAAILALPVNDGSLSERILFDDPFLLALPINHPLADLDRADPSLLHDLKLLLLDEGHCLRDQALDVCYRHGGQEDPDFRATSLETLRMMVQAGTGITLMPEIAVRNDAGIRYVRFKAPAPKRRIGLVWRKTSARTVLIDRLFELFSAVFREAVSRGGSQK